MTVVDTIIHYQFRFEYGIGKAGVYVTIINFGLLIVANLTLKEIFFPIWGIVPIAIVLAIFFTVIGDFLIKYNVAGRLNSHMNRTANPEFAEMIEQINRIESALGIKEEPLMWEVS